MSTTHQLRCTDCGIRIAAEAGSSDFRCPECNGLYEVVYPWSPGGSPGPRASDPASDVRLPNPGALRYRWQELRTSTLSIDQSGVWRFRDLLPILNNFDNVVTLREGNTPLYEMPRSAQIAGVDWLLAKHQGMNPTGSFKDTGMTAAMSVAVERGFKWVACASTGNTSAAMAAYAARAGLRSIVFIPEGKIAWGKLSQSMDYGALTVQLKTDFDGCVRLLLELVRRFPIYLLNSVNPYRLEGQKTPAMEIVEQMEWQVPEHIVVPGGNLANSSALGKGFQEMKHIGLIPRVPKISIIQAEGANPLFRWFSDSNREMKPVTAETRATAIRIGNPASWRKAARVIEQMGGWCEQATEQEIALAKAEIGAEGVGCEPASAVTLAGLKKLVAQGRVKPGERVVLILTGHTLKDSQYTIDYHRGELLTASELASATPSERDSHEALRKPPIVLEADESIVLRALEKQMAAANAAEPVASGNARMSHTAGPVPSSIHLPGPIRLVLPATSANLGPGFDSVGLAMALHLTIDAEPAPIGGNQPLTIQATGRDADRCARTSNNLIFETYRSLLERAGRYVTPLHLQVHNEIPLGMGCGSSAAALLAGVTLANHFGQLGWNLQKCMEEACRREGHPDNVAACVHGYLTVSTVVVDAQSSSVAAATTGQTTPWKFLLALPSVSLATEKARALLPPEYNRPDVVANLQRTALLVAAFAQGRGDLLRVAMQDRLHQPYRMQACPLLPLLLPLAGESGILGVALSGAGPAVLLVAAPDASELIAARIRQAADDSSLEIIETAMAPGAAVSSSG